MYVVGEHLKCMSSHKHNICQHKMKRGFNLADYTFSQNVHIWVTSLAHNCVCKAILSHTSVTFSCVALWCSMMLHDALWCFVMQWWQHIATMNTITNRCHMTTQNISHSNWTRGNTETLGMHQQVLLLQSYNTNVHLKHLVTKCVHILYHLQYATVSAPS